jgi:N-acetylneuraminic acid mutarotase
MIVYGEYSGSANGGRSYDPIAKTWKVISTTGQPTERDVVAAVWTGTKMIEWGGARNQGATEWADGGIYDPVTDTWSAMPQTGAIPTMRGGHSAVWTGTRMIIWGGGRYGDFSAADHLLNDGASYDPATGIWTAISSVNAPTPRYAHTAVWTGSKMIVWGGKEQNSGERNVNDGAAYDPATDTWTPISTTNAPEARWGHVAVWSNIGMIVWGGQATSGHPTDLYLYH